MKFDSKNRLDHLGAIRHAKVATVRDASDRATDLRARCRRAQGRLRQIETDYLPKDAAETAEKIAAEIDTLKEELAAAEARRDRVGQEFQAAAACHEAARNYAVEHGLPMPSEDAAEVAAISGGVE
ncbi:hypothetical protein [Roseovarius sp.]|uniref:hypothetical protein n=1 Tax=Roseovarius sp. TaxID=1486281 RepID=UPI003BA8B1C3